MAAEIKGTRRRRLGGLADDPTGRKPWSASRTRWHRTPHRRAFVTGLVLSEEVFVTAKLWNSDHGYDEPLLAFDASHRRFGLYQVDLFLLQWPVPHPACTHGPRLGASWLRAPHESPSSFASGEVSTGGRLFVTGA
jgi:hypothetical protein